jgi:predicted XRE-type DNA-binding protein
MSTNILLSKDHISNVVNDYSKIVSQVDEIIAQTGYKGRFIAKKLGIPESSFYAKKRNKSFTLNEMLRLVDMMDEDDDAIEDAYFMKIYEERKNDEIIYDF